LIDIKIPFKDYLDTQSTIYYWLADRKVPNKKYVVYSFENEEDAVAFKLKFPCTNDSV
jgi:hypothetical protein